MRAKSTSMQRYFLHFLLLALLRPMPTCSQRVQQYCSFSPQHTMCRTTGIGPACAQNVPARGVSETDAAAIVASHNRHRARVAQGLETRGAPGPQPQAGDMLEMVWDEELALIAQRHADQCVFEHECADCRQVGRFSVGQNLYIAFDSTADISTQWDSAIQAWYDEVDLVPSTDVASYNFNPSTGHYTQLVWGSTGYVGCGFTMYEEGGWYKKLYTCNYGPAGNMMFSAMYQAGPACSACPQGTSCSLAYPGLCASNSDPKGSQAGLTIGENLASFEPNQRLIPGSSRSLIQSQPTVNELAAALSQLDLNQLSIPDLLSLLATVSENNARTSIESARPWVNEQASVTTQIPSDTPGNTQIFSQTPLSELPPHPATVALQRQRQQNRQRLPQQQGVASGPRNSAPSPAPTSGVVDPRLLQTLPVTDTLNKFLINVGTDSQIIKTDSLASVKDVLSSLPAGSNPLVFFRSNMGTLRQLSNRGLMAAADSRNRSRKIRSTKPPALQLLDTAEPLDLPTSVAEKDNSSSSAVDANEFSNSSNTSTTFQSVDSDTPVSVMFNSELVPDTSGLLKSGFAAASASPGFAQQDFSEKLRYLLLKFRAVPGSSSTLEQDLLENPTFVTSLKSGSTNPADSLEPLDFPLNSESLKSMALDASAAADISAAVGAEKMLLSCQDAAAPCPVVALAGDWTHGETATTNGSSAEIRSLLAPGEGGQLVLGQALPPPESGAACVGLSYRFLATGQPAPQVAISVWPLGQVLLQEDLDRVSVPEGDGWQVTSVSFAPIRNAFMVVLTVEPNPADSDVEIRVRGFRVAEGLC